MGDIVDLLSLKEIKVIEGSDFNSSYGSYLEHIGEIPDKMDDLKEILLARINNKVSTGVNDLIESASPTPSHLIVYELGCGLQIILPIDKAKGTLTASGEVFLDRALVKYIEFQKKEINTPPYYECEVVLGFKQESRKGLIKLLKGKDFMPLALKDLNPRDLGEYLIIFSDPKCMIGMYTEREVRFDDLKLIFGYIAHMNQGENPDRVQSFEIKYEVKGPKKETSVVIDANYHKEGYYETSAFITIKKESGFESNFKFENEGLSRSCIEVSGQNKELMFSREFLQTISSGMKSEQAITCQDLAALHILNMPSLNSRLDYVSTITNILKIALMPAEEIKSNWRDYTEGLEQFKPLIFR